MELNGRPSMDQTTFAQSAFLRHFCKQWPKSFSEPHEMYDDRPWLEETLAALQSTNNKEPGDYAELFFLTYDDGQASLDVRAAIEFLQRATSDNLCEPHHSKKKGTAWVDDRDFTQSGVQLNIGDSSITTTGLSPITGQPSHTTLEGLPCTSDIAQSSIPAGASDITDSTIVAHTSSPLLCVVLEALLFKVHSSSTARSPRIYRAPLTAGDLNTILREKRFHHLKYQDAHRRLICIPDPDPYDFSALIRNVTAQEHKAVKESMCNYLALRTSIKATVPEEGFREFRFSFDIPYFALRRCQSQPDFEDRRKRAHRGWMNVSSLNTNQGNPDEAVWGIHLVHISVTVCGVHETNWTAFCFDDRYFDEDSEIGAEEQTADHQNDQIALGEFSAETVISDPREYFLRVYLIRMRQVRKEWNDLHRFIEKGIEKPSWGRHFFSPTRNGIPTERNDATVLNILDSTSDLVGKMLDEIIKQNTAWACFFSTRGGFEYFSDTHTNERMRGIVNQLDEVFGELLQLQGNLRHLAAQIDKMAQTVNLRLISEGKKNAELTVYIISPIAVVSTFFAIPDRILDFDRNILSFGVAIALCMVGLHALLFFWGGKLWRQHWWVKISRRAKAAWNGDPSLTTVSQSGENKLRRRATHAHCV